MTELVYVLVLETRFCEFESRLGHQVFWGISIMGLRQLCKLFMGVRSSHPPPSFMDILAETIYASRELQCSTVAREHQGLNPWISTNLRLVHIMAIIADCLSVDGSSILPRVASFVVVVSRSPINI